MAAGDGRTADAHLSMKIECDRDDVAFIAVSPTVRLSLPVDEARQEAEKRQHESTFEIAVQSKQQEHAVGACQRRAVSSPCRMRSLIWSALVIVCRVRPLT